MPLLYEEKNVNYWRNKIAASKGDTKRMWRPFQSVLGEVSTADINQSINQSINQIISETADSKIEIQVNDSVQPLTEVRKGCCQR